MASRSQMPIRRRSGSLNLPPVVTSSSSHALSSSVSESPGDQYRRTAGAFDLYNTPHLSRKSKDVLGRGIKSPGYVRGEEDGLSSPIASSSTTGRGRSPTSPGPGSPPQAAQHMRSMSYSKQRDDLQDTGPWKSGDKFHFPLSKPEAGAWEILHSLVKDYDKGMCAAWRDEIDKVIIFAGLFAATVVAFLVVSYLMLKLDPQDIQTDILRHIAMQQDIFYAAYVNGSIQDAKFSPLPPPPTTFHPKANAVRVNGAMFLSVTIALSTVLLGTTCLQWIREYERDCRLGPKEAAALRQMRLEGLNYWRVPVIISSLPILLQVAVGLFFWGLCEFLWVINDTITIINITAIGTVSFFVFVTFSLPALQSIFITQRGIRRYQVPFKSPQARLFSLIAFWCAKKVIYVILLWKPDNPYITRKFLEDKKVFLENLTRPGSGADWVAFDIAWQAERLVQLKDVAAHQSRDIPRSVAWVAQTHVHSQVAIAGVYKAMMEIYPSTGMQVLRRLLISSRSRPGNSYGNPCPASTPGGKTNSRDWEASIDKFVETHKDTHEEVLNDVKFALMLDCLVKENEQLTAPLLHIRVELFIRIINWNVGDQMGTGPKVDVWSLFSGHPIEWDFGLLVPFSKKQNFQMVPDVCRIQLIRSFKAYMKIGRYHDILWEIVLPLVFQTVVYEGHDISPEMLCELNTFNEELKQGIVLIGIGSQDTCCVHRRVSGYIGDMQPYKDSKKSPEVLQNFMEQLQNLMNYLNPPVSPDTLSVPSR